MTTRTKADDLAVAEFAQRGWEVWSVRCFPGHLQWSARPIGARVAVIIGQYNIPDLEHKITEYEADLEWHVLQARQKLDAFDDDAPAAAQEVPACLIIALAELKARMPTM